MPYPNYGTPGSPNLDPYYVSPEDEAAMEEEILGEDYRYTADLLRKYAANDRKDLFQAVCSNNLNIILAALDIAEAA